ncbi:unnamed protein product [Litomosoides sigmodontis]|uniref:ERCC4 domain-containing protein n=1 Tax=Litomosoides sigmodontis TaxID=42156 RepID=A0A3P6U422_LITSI|nr:unnamed protein product [Litomosoides sigmodontis]
MDDSVIILSEDEDGIAPNCSNVLKSGVNKQVPECGIYDEKETKEEPVPSSSRILVDIQNRPSLKMDNATVQDLSSSDDDGSTDSHGLDEIPECGDFTNWCSHESFSQPVQSSPVIKETQLTTNELAVCARDERAPSICIARTVSDGSCMDKKRKKRTKGEILAEQAAKEEARRKKKEERIANNKRNELEKQLAKFEREVSAAKKSKCEQNLLCIICLDLITEINNLDQLVTKLFTDRGIRDQLVFDGVGMTICWKRRILQGEVENDEFVRGEKLMYEQFCILSMNAQRYGQFKSTEEIVGFVEECLKKYPFPSPQLTLVVYGLLKLRKEKVADFVLEIFECFRVQTRFIVTPEEYALLIAQMHRAIARNESRLEEQILPIVNVEKGIMEGDDSTIISDWWMKMLSQVHRMGTDAQRAIANRFPNPHALSKLLRTMPMKEGTKLLADTKLDYGKRIGSALARKIYLILTSTSGTEIIDQN